MSTWRSEARCVEVDPEVWFPEPGRMDTVAAARRICAVCEVSGECLAEALAGDLYEIWGGTTKDERKAMRRQARRARRLAVAA